MWEGLRWTVFLGIAAGCAGFPSAAQNTAPPVSMTATVLNALPQPPQPVNAAQLSLSYLNSGARITQGVTNLRGQAQLVIPAARVQRGDLRVQVSGDSAKDLVIWQPADGQLSPLLGNGATVPISLLPKGSPLLMDLQQIPAYVNRFVLEVNQLQSQNRDLRVRLAAKDFLDLEFTQWARENGFKPEDIEDAVKNWAGNVLRNRIQATDEQKARAAYVSQQYGLAAELFGQAVDSGWNDINDDLRKQQEEELKRIQHILDNAYLQANSFWMENNYHEATAVLESADNHLVAMQRSFEDNPGFNSVMREAMGHAADAREEEAVGGKAANSAQLLSQSIRDYHELIQQYSDLGEREQLAHTLNSLGNALTDQAMRSGPEQRTGLLAQSIAAFRAALEVQKAGLPQDWARTEDNQGVALWRVGENGDVTQSKSVLAQSEAAFRAALQVETKQTMAPDWAMTKNNLGLVLTDEADRSNGAQARQFLTQAVTATNEALSVFTEKGFPTYWAMAQATLGVALRKQGEHGSGTQANASLAQAVQAFRDSERVRTRDKSEADWAREENNLCVALRIEGEHSSGAEALRFFHEAVDHCNQALEVRTKAAFPPAFAWTENNLGNALLDLGEHANGAEAKALVAQAANEQRKALDVFTQSYSPQDWATTQDYLGNALQDEAANASGAEAESLFTQAHQAFEKALEVQKNLVQPWAKTEDDLGNALRIMGERASGTQAAALFNQAVEAEDAALQVFEKTDLPYQWVRAESNLATALADRGDSVGAAKALDACVDDFPTDAKVIQRVAFVYHDKLFQYGRSLALTERWVKSDATSDARMSLVEEELTAGHFAECGAQAEKIDDAAFTAPAQPMILIRDALKLTCQWGAGQKAAAQQTASALLPKNAGMEKTSWDFEGTLHFLASAPEFQAGRASWASLFQSLEDGDGAAMTKALQELEEVMSR